MSLAHIFDRLQAQETALVGTRVLAPIVGGRRVTVKVGGVACQLAVDSNERGWSVLQVQATTRATWLRAATLIEREKYLALLPAVRFIALERNGEIWQSFPAYAGDARFQLNGVAPIRGVQSANVQMFDSIVARFDGTHFWFDKADARRSPAIAEYLRQSLAQQIAPDALHKKGLNPEERAAYAYALYGPPPEIVAPGDAATSPLSFNPLATIGNLNTPDGRLAQSLNHAGGRLVSWMDRGDAYTVTYQFGAQTHTSTVRADDLSIVTSGICLSGRDRDFDLTSLVGVMREAASEQPWQFEDYD